MAGVSFFGFDDKVNDLFSTYEKIRIADAKGDIESVKAEIEDGLARSCVLLKDIAAFYVEAELKPDTRKRLAKEALSLFAQEGALDRFLEAERAILSQSSFLSLIHI